MGALTMKLRNSTDYPNHFLRRMIGWCCRQIGLSQKHLRRVDVTNCTGTHRGRAWWYEVLLRIGPASSFPSMPNRYGGFDYPSYGDRTEALIAIAGHELAHIEQNHRGQGRRRDRERLCGIESMRCLNAFRADRERLMAEWGRKSERSAALSVPKPSLIEQRAAKAAADLARWQRKLKLAQTKVRQYKQRVAYYAKKGPKPRPASADGPSASGVRSPGRGV